MSLWIPQVIINTVNQERGKGYTTGKNINGHRREGGEDTTSKNIHSHRREEGRDPTGKNINGHTRDNEGYCNVLCDKLLYPSTPRVYACMLL